MRSGVKSVVAYVGVSEKRSGGGEEKKRRKREERKEREKEDRGRRERRERNREKGESGGEKERERETTSRNLASNYSHCICSIIRGLTRPLAAQSVSNIANQMVIVRA